MHRGGKEPCAFGEMRFNLFAARVTGYEQGREGVHLGADQTVLATPFLLFGHLSPCFVFQQKDTWLCSCVSPLYRSFGS